MAFLSQSTLQLKRLYARAIQSDDHSVVAEAEQTIRDFCDRLQKEEDIKLRMEYANVVERYRLKLAELRQKRTKLFNSSKEKKAQQLLLDIEESRNIFIVQSLESERQQEMLKNGLWDSTDPSQEWALRPATSMLREMFTEDGASSLLTHSSKGSKTEEERADLLRSEYLKLMRNTLNPRIRLRKEEIFGFDPDVAPWKHKKDVGNGTHGRVYTIVVDDPDIQEDSNAVFAVKEIKYKNARQKANMNKECQLLSGMERHNHVVALVAYRFWTGIGNIFMEYVSGGDLHNLLKYAGPVASERECKPLLRQILIGLQFLHHKHIVHRDIKGSNILITLQGCVKIGDFGSAKEITTQNLTSEDDYYAGSVYWMSPEIAPSHLQELQNLKPYATDIWSLGCVIIEMLTAIPPWPKYHMSTPNDPRKLDRLLLKKLSQMAGGQQPLEAPPLDSSLLSPQGKRVLQSIFVRSLLRPDVDTLLADPWFQVTPGLLLHDVPRAKSH